MFVNQIKEFSDKIRDVLISVINDGSSVRFNPNWGLRVYIETPSKHLRDIDFDNIRIDEHGNLIIPAKEKWDHTP